jgi:hypothetical protein
LKKEITIAACSAVALIILLGSVSYLMFPKVSVPANRVPSVSISPASIVVAVDRPQLFTSSVSGGTSPYSYQWYLNGTAVSGATNSSWTFTPASSGSYTVYVNTTDKIGSIGKSNIAIVQGWNAATLDAFTQLGGEGTDQLGGNFSISQRDNVTIYAEVRNASNISQGSRLVSYEIHWPAHGPQNGSIYAIGTSETNASGMAEISRIPLWAPEFQTPSQDPRGSWLVYVTTSIDDQPLFDTLTFFVQQ